MVRMICLIINSLADLNDVILSYTVLRQCKITAENRGRKCTNDSKDICKCCGNREDGPLFTSYVYLCFVIIELIFFNFVTSDALVRSNFDTSIVPFDYVKMKTPEEGFTIGDIVVTKYAGCGECKGLVTNFTPKNKLAVLYLDGRVRQVPEKSAQIIRPAAYVASFTWAEAVKAKDAAYIRLASKPKTNDEAETLLMNYSLSVANLNQKSHESQLQQVGGSLEQERRDFFNVPHHCFRERKFEKFIKHICLRIVQNEPRKMGHIFNLYIFLFF